VVWLYKLAKNRCLMSRRKSKFAPAHELSLEELMPDRKELEQLSSDGKINPESFAIRSEQASRLREAVQKLPPQYRMVLVLRDMEGLTDDEVAEITGVRPGTVRVRLHRARLFVRKELMRTWMAQSGKKVHAQRRPSKRAGPHVARPCSQNCPIISTSNWTILFAKNWNATWMAANPARFLWQLWKLLSSSVEGRRGSVLLPRPPICGKN